MNFEVGSTIGDYQVIGILGAGGMGKVYKVRNTISDRVEAMKVLLPDLANEPDLADRFLREIKVQASLEHPNIAALHTAVRVDNQLLMLMEFVEGETLEQKLREGPIPTAQAVDYIRQMLAALEYAHGRGVIHRDIKPANMMLTPEGVVKLMDFGIAKAATDRRLTMTGTTMGSLYYMSPEQIEGTAGLDARSDLYSMGVSLYELVTGKRPFDGDSQFAIMSAHLQKTPVPPIQLDPSLPPLLNDVILMSVLKDPNARFQSAAAFRNALGNVTGLATRQHGGAATQAPPRMPTVPAVAAVAPAANAQQPMAAPPPAPPPPRPRGKRGLWMGIGAAAAVAAVIAVIELGPFKGISAQSNASRPPASGQAAPPKEAPQPAPAQPVPADPQQTAGSGTPPAPPPDSTAPQATPPADSKARPEPKNPPRQQQAPPQKTQEPAQQPAANAQRPPSQPAQEPPPQPMSQPVAQPQPQAVPAPQPDPAVRAQLDGVRKQLTMLNVRADGIREALQRLESTQSSAGMGLNSRLAGPRALMNQFLEAATNALNSGDAAGAREHFRNAERQVEILEKALNR